MVVPGLAERLKGQLLDKEKHNQAAASALACKVQSAAAEQLLHTLLCMQ